MNQDHVKKLLEGVEHFNEWRKLNLNIRPDLSNAKLADAELNGADLNNANLSGADLSGAALIEATLIGADLSRADLSGADLTGASGFCVGYPSEILAGNKDNPPLWKRITVRNLARFRYPQALALIF